MGPPDGDIPKYLKSEPNAKDILLYASYKTPFTAQGDKKADDEDLSLRMWQLSGDFVLELNLELRGRSPKVLPMNDNGDLLPDKVASKEFPFFKVTPSKLPSQKLDLSCDQDTCHALWKRFPMSSYHRRELLIETNLRGLASRKWRVTLNQSRTFESDLSPEKKVSEGIRVRTVFDTNLLAKAGVATGSRITGFEDWIIDSFRESNPLPFQTTNAPLLVAAVQGSAIVDVSMNGSLESRQLDRGHLVWIDPGLNYRIRNLELRPGRLYKMNLQK